MALGRAAAGLAAAGGLGVAGGRRGRGEEGIEVAVRTGLLGEPLLDVGVAAAGRMQLSAAEELGQLVAGNGEKPAAKSAL